MMASRLGRRPAAHAADRSTTTYTGRRGIARKMRDGEKSRGKRKLGWNFVAKGGRMGGMNDKETTNRVDDGYPAR
ncbi:MAG: hypothetical protein J6Y19_11375, partial [Kiritimatiellae bacterium]|nr:hypothetical protein [Kiritimatiellia bacterium]